MTPDQVIALMNAGQLEAAHREAQSAAQAHPQSAKAWLLLARIEARQEKYAEAAAHLKRAQALPQWKALKLFVPVQSRSVIDQSTQHDPRAALGLVADGLLANPGNAQLLYLKALAHARLGQNAQARAALARAESASPGLTFAEPHRLAALRKAVAAPVQQAGHAGSPAPASPAPAPTYTTQTVPTNDHSLDGVTLQGTPSSAPLMQTLPFPTGPVIGVGVIAVIFAVLAARWGKRRRENQADDLQSWASEQQKLLDTFVEQEQASSFGQHDPASANRVAESYALSQWLWQQVGQQVGQGGGGNPEGIKAEFYRRMALLRGAAPADPMLPPQPQGFGGARSSAASTAPPVVVHQGGAVFINHPVPVIVAPPPPVPGGFGGRSPEPLSSPTDMGQSSSFTSDSPSSFSGSDSSSFSSDSGSSFSSSDSSGPDNSGGSSW